MIRLRLRQTENTRHDKFSISILSLNSNKSVAPILDFVSKCNGISISCSFTSISVLSLWCILIWYVHLLIFILSVYLHLIKKITFHYIFSVWKTTQSTHSMTRSNCDQMTSTQCTYQIIYLFFKCFKSNLWHLFCNYMLFHILFVSTNQHWMDDLLILKETKGFSWTIIVFVNLDVSY